MKEVPASAKKAVVCLDISDDWMVRSHNVLFFYNLIRWTIQVCGTANKTVSLWYLPTMTLAKTLSSSVPHALRFLPDGSACVRIAFSVDPC